MKQGLQAYFLYILLVLHRLGTTLCTDDTSVCRPDPLTLSVPRADWGLGGHQGCKWLKNIHCQLFQLVHLQLAGF